MRVRAADPDRDAHACAAIYAPYVTGSVATFEIDPPSAPDMARRMAASHLWLVAEAQDGAVAGYAYASTHRERAAYRWAADVAVYIEGAHTGQGVGRALYAALIPQLRERGLWTLCAGVALPNEASEALHRGAGFTPVGTYRRIGWKAGAWRDVRWWQLDLRPGDAAPPAGG